MTTRARRGWATVSPGGEEGGGTHCAAPTAGRPPAPASAAGARGSRRVVPGRAGAAPGRHRPAVSPSRSSARAWARPTRGVQPQRRARSVRSCPVQTGSSVHSGSTPRASAHRAEVVPPGRRLAGQQNRGRAPGDRAQLGVRRRSRPRPWPRPRSVPRGPRRAPTAQVCAGFTPRSPSPNACGRSVFQTDVAPAPAIAGGRTSTVVSPPDLGQRGVGGVLRVGVVAAPRAAAGRRPRPGRPRPPSGRGRRPWTRAPAGPPRRRGRPGRAARCPRRRPRAAPPARSPSGGRW